MACDRDVVRLEQQATGEAALQARLAGQLTLLLPSLVLKPNELKLVSVRLPVMGSIGSRVLAETGGAPGPLRRKPGRLKLFAQLLLDGEVPVFVIEILAVAIECFGL